MDKARNSRLTFDLTNPATREISDKMRDEVRKDCLEKLEKSDEFILIYVDKEDGGIATKTSLSGYCIPTMIKATIVLQKQLIDNVMENGDIVVITALGKVLAEEAMKNEKSRE